MQKIILLMASLAVSTWSAQAQAPTPSMQHANTRFEQLGPSLPTPNTFRTASGAPGKGLFSEPRRL